MDPLSDLLRMVRLDGAYFYCVEAADPWSVSTRHARELRRHAERVVLNARTPSRVAAYFDAVMPKLGNEAWPAHRRGDERRFVFWLSTSSAGDLQERPRA